MIIYISDFNLSGSGYMNLSIELCKQLAAAGYDVKALGIGYKGEEHTFPISLIPVPVQGAVQYASTALNNLINSKLDIEAIIVALDIPLQEGFLGIPRQGAPYIGIFPVESGPICRAWASHLMKMDDRLIISEYGRKVAEAAGLPAKHLQIGLDLESWRPPLPDERIKIRKTMGYEDDEFIILTVADNHERKNLSAAFEMVARARARGMKVRFVLVTRVDFRGGYIIPDLAYDFKITDIFAPFERGLPFGKLWMLYASADVMLIASKAEGLGLPILEAMAVGLPNIATKCTAIEDHLSDGRGLMIESDYKFIDPWGNSERVFPSIQDGVDKLEILKAMSEEDRQQMAAKALAYVESRTWDKAGKILIESVKRLSAERPANAEQTEKITTDISIF